MQPSSGIDSITARKILARAAASAGGAEQLAAKLGIGQRLVLAYITGAEPIPDLILLRSVDLVVEEIPQLVKDASDAAKGGGTTVA